MKTKPFDQIYKKLETDMVSYNDLLSVKVIETKDPFVTLKSEDVLYGYNPRLTDMEIILGKAIFVRSKVARKLKNAQKILQSQYPTYSLYVTYGYRSLEIQTERFIKILKDKAIYFPNALDLYELIHRSVAVPTVAGHPTGGAIDITIFDTQTKEFLDFGSDQYDYTNKKFYVFAPDVSENGKKNRLLLRDCMLQADFAPFDGEWWHFCYGDREWAYYYKKSTAIYSQISSQDVAKNMLS